VIRDGSESVELVCGAFGLTAEPGASLIAVSRGAMGRVWCLELAVLDWDDAGPACPDRELAGLLMFWHGHDDGTVDDAAVQRTLVAYRASGGPGRLRGGQSFGMYIACRLNFLEAQASVALDPGAAPEHRAYASSEISDTLARLPMPSLISHLTSLAAATLG
jgi:hypothetical protein